MNINNKLKRCNQHISCVHRQLISAPGSLQGICYAKLKVAVISANNRRFLEVFNLASSKKSMKEYLSQLPITCREQLLENIISTDEVNDYFEVGVSDILFSHGVTKLELNLNVASAYCEAMLELVSTEGQELRTFKLGGMYFFHMSESHYGHFRNIFTCAQNLSTLQLPYICDDEMFKLIGENCSCLQNLDASSSLFTNKGLHLLTQNIGRLPPGTVNGNTTWESTLWRLSGVFLPLEKLVPPGEEAVNYERRKSPLCGTLRSLNIDQPCDVGDPHVSEKISTKTILALLEMIPNLESLGEINIDILCEDKDLLTAMIIFELPSLSLNSAILHSTNKNKVSIVSRLFPNLVCLKSRSLTAFAVTVPWSLSTFNTLNHLECLKVSCPRGVLAKIDLRELSSGLRNNLRELEIDTNSSLDPFKISSILTFPRLTRIQLFSPKFVWDSSEYFSSLEHLDDVDLFGSVTTEVVIKILQCAPNLKKLRILYVVDRGTDFLHRIMGASESSKLESFEQIRDFLIDTEEELRSFLAHFDKIQHVGRIRFLTQW